MSELLPCPFCGGDELSHGWNYAGVEWAQAECHNDACQAHVFAATEAEAIAAWNTRASERTGAGADRDEIAQIVARAYGGSLWPGLGVLGDYPVADEDYRAADAIIALLPKPMRGEPEALGEMVLVPREPTEAMLALGTSYNAAIMRKYDDEGWLDVTGAMWSAMLSAAPEQRSADGEVERALDALVEQIAESAKCSSEQHVPSQDGEVDPSNADWLRGDWYERWQDSTENADSDLMSTLESLRVRVERTILAALAASPIVQRPDQGDGRE